MARNRKNGGDKFESKRDNRSGRNNGQRESSNKIFTLNKEKSQLIDSLNKESLKHIGYGVEGVTVTTANLNNLTTSAKLPLLGNELEIKPIFQDKMGEDAFLSIEQMVKLPYVKNTISSEEDLTDAAKDLTKITAAMPFCVVKTIAHNYKGIKNVVSANRNNLYTYRLYREDLANIAKTMMDSQGTNFIINNLVIKTTAGNKTETQDALPYLLYVYDVLMIKAMLVFTHYTAWRNAINYGEKVTERRNDFRNKINGPIFMSSTMNSAIESYVASLGKYFLPLRYFQTMISPNCIIGKKTSGRTTPLEITKVKVNIPDLLDIYGPDGTTVVISKDHFKNLNNALNDIEDMYSLMYLENIYNNPQLTALELRKYFINKWDAATYALNNLYDELYDLFVGLQRALQSGIIKCYTNPDNYAEQLSALKELMVDSELRQDNGSAILGYNYVEQVTTQPLPNGTLCTTPFIPSISTWPTLASDTILFFKGESTLFDPLYETNLPVYFTFNQAIAYNGTNVNSSVKSGGIIKQVNPGAPEQNWQVELYLNSKQVRVSGDHPIVSYLVESVCSEFNMSTLYWRTSTSKEYKDVYYTHPKRLTRIEYTVNTIGEHIKAMFQYYMIK